MHESVRYFVDAKMSDIKESADYVSWDRNVHALLGYRAGLAVSFRSGSAEVAYINAAIDSLSVPAFAN